MRKLTLLFFIFVVLLLVSCTNNIPESYGEIEFYFCHLANCDEVFAELVATTSSLACAFYDLDNKYVRQSLIEQNAAVVVDEHEKEKMSFLSREGDGLMHNKFCVINHSFVITGSYNPTTDDSYDNVVTIASVPIALHYEEQFSQLLKKQKHPSKHTFFIHNDAVVEVYACPQDNCAQQLHRHIQQANISITFSLFTFTDKELTTILLEKHKQGVLITGIVESFQSKKYNQYYVLEKAGVNVILEDSPRLQHNKVFVIDNKTVITGSYNPTRAANTINDENIIIFHNSLIAQHYTALVEDTIKRTQSFKYGSVLS